MNIDYDKIIKPEWHNSDGSFANRRISHCIVTPLQIIPLDNVTYVYYNKQNSGYSDTITVRKGDINLNIAASEMELDDDVKPKKQMGSSFYPTEEEYVNVLNMRLAALFRCIALGLGNMEFNQFFKPYVPVNDNKIVIVDTMGGSTVDAKVEITKFNRLLKSLKA